jgi:hypothetical protein
VAARDRNLEQRRAHPPRSRPQREIHASCFSAQITGSARDDCQRFLFIGRAALDRKESCTLEAGSRWLLYTVTVNGGWVTLKLALMDQAQLPECVLIARDGDEGWRRVSSIIRCLEREEVKSLEKPIVLGGGSGPNGYVIG